MLAIEGGGAGEDALPVTKESPWLSHDPRGSQNDTLSCCRPGADHDPLPPGKVADSSGCQYMRDNDPTNLGHNTDFMTIIAFNVLHILNTEQIEKWSEGKEVVGRTSRSVQISDLLYFRRSVKALVGGLSARSHLSRDCHIVLSHRQITTESNNYDGSNKQKCAFLSSFPSLDY